MLHYILQVVAFQLLFLIIYDVFLRKETFFNLNRAYLLVTAALSVVIPFIKIEQIKTIVAKDFVIRLPEVIIGNPSENISTIDPQIAMQAGFNLGPESMSIWNIILISGMSIATLLLLIKITKLFWLASQHPKQWKGNFLIVNLMNSTKAFSFFHYIFLGEKLNAQEKSSILEHEIVHVKHKHTLDLLFFELFRIAFWFNPLVYIYQNRIATLHEYIADAKAVKQSNKADYYDNLLAQVFETQQFSFVNPFFKHSLIKKRILMLSKSKSKQINMIKYVLLLPLVFTMLIYTSSYAQKTVVNKVVEKLNSETQDLSKYSFTMRLGDSDMNEKTKVIHESYEAFLKSNSNYVSWATYDKKNNRVCYSVHSIDEKIPEGYSMHEVNFKDGASYVSFMNYGTAFKTESKASGTRYEEFKTEIIKTENEDVETKIIDSHAEVPFSIVEETPTFTFCDTFKTNDERKKCLSDNVAKHVNKNFNMDLATKLGLVGRQRINVIFKIDREGNVIGVRARAPHPKLEEEAIRVINTLPQFIPGKQKGKPVIVPYSLPIIFQVHGNSNSNLGKVDLEKPKESFKYASNEVPFAIIEQVPTFSFCDTFTSEEERKKCMMDNVAKHVNKNFNMDLAAKLGLTGRQRINVIFKIDQEGRVIDVKARAPHPKLEEETIRVINTLPQFIPGKQKGQPVVVPYSLPITFQVSN
ncbi:MAG: M56 family metallopeptidase [Psychroserpens sp.]|uniref:M56 family metallopeptidase n=1 Tax=Psychroserpens sp. TaxID=2020870 RepID=UPI00300253D2